MQRAKHQVTGERRLNGNVCNFAISNFTDQDDVRRLTQHALEHDAEGKADLFADLHLIDAVEVVLNGIFSGDDLAVRRVENGQRRIQRGGLAGTGRSGDQEDSVRAANDLVEDIQ